MKKILIIDDEKIIHESLKLILYDLASDIDSVFTPAEALIKVENTPYKLIICDYNLPEINGIDLIQKIKKKGFTGHIFLYTGNPPAVALGLLGTDKRMTVIEKPICDVDEFRKKILLLSNIKFIYD